jgi:hypothetical protein
MGPRAFAKPTRQDAPRLPVYRAAVQQTPDGFHVPLDVHFIEISLLYRVC